MLYCKQSVVGIQRARAPSQRCENTYLIIKFAMKTLLVLLCFNLYSCSFDDNRAVAPETEDSAIAVKIAIPAALLQSVARVEYLVEGEDMDVLRGALEIAGNSARGTVRNIPPGKERIFTLNVYDTSDQLSHTGSTKVDIVAGRTAQVRISLRALAGAAEVIGDFGQAPLFAKAGQLVGTWQLELPGDESFEFTYTFAADGSFKNRIGGAFLQALRELDEFRELDLGRLDQFDGGFVEFSGIWRPSDGTLDLEYEQVKLELFASLPLLGNISLDVLREDLGAGAESAVSFDCAVDGNELLLRGDSLTLGVPLATETGDQIGDNPLFADLSSIARAALAQMSSALGQVISNNKLDQVVLVRVE